MSSSFTLSADIREMFFDREKVMAKIGKDRAKQLSRVGAFLRTRSRSKLRRRKKASQPGKPPSIRSRSKYATLKNILFGLDSDAMSVLVGPIAVPKYKLRSSSAETVPELMEFGGTTTNRSKKKSRRVDVAKRPWMGPTLEEEAEAGTLVDFFIG